MKLLKEQITYIDDYLKHHKVKYWDIRIELLDHIVTTVEEKMEQGISFDYAMIEVHKSFGNSMKMFWNSGIEYGIFANGHGFKSLIEDKRKSIKKNYNRLLKKEIASFFKSLKTVFPYVLIVFFFVLMYKELSSRSFVLLAFTIPLSQFIYSIVTSVQMKKYKKSALVEVSVSQFMLSIFTFYNLIHVFNIFEIEKATMALFYLIITMLVIPLFYASSKVLNKLLSEYKSLHNKFAA